jgi:aminopeptidase YwaD
MRNALALSLSLILILAAGARADEHAGLKAVSKTRIKARVDYLASDALAGRKAGTAGGRLASSYLAAELAKLKLKPAGTEGYFQPFGAMRNVLGSIPGSQPGQAIVIGAHFDHVGSVYNGADDNASGCAAVLEIAQAFKASGIAPKRTLIFAFFDGEEDGKLGSKHYLSASPPEVVLMLNFDMVGRMWSRRLNVVGLGTSPLLGSWLKASNAGIGVRLKTYKTVSSSSDHAPFHARGIPVLARNTGFHDDYHQPTDDVDKLNIPGIAQVSRLFFRVALLAAQSSQDLRAHVKKVSKGLAGNLSH